MGHIHSQRLLNFNSGKGPLTASPQSHQQVTPLFRVSQNHTCPSHLLDTQSCAYKFPVCIQGSFAGKALLEKLLTSHREEIQGHHLHVMELLGLWNFWHCTKNSGPWMMPRVGPGLNLKLLGQKRETIKDQNFIYKHEVRTASVTSYHCPSFPLFQSLLAFAYRHFRMKLLQRKMNFYCQEDAAK